MSAAVQSLIATGSTGTVVDIECHLSNNLPNIIIVGSVSKAVDEARERIRGSFATSHIRLPRKRVIINLAPADIPKADSGFDLPIAVAILAADGQVRRPLSRQQAFIGELGLDGQTRAVRGIIGKLLVGRAKGITTFFIPTANLSQAQLVPDIQLVAIDSLEQLYQYLQATTKLPMRSTGKGHYGLIPKVASGVQLSEIVGQPQAKRALEIAAAGGHNLFLSGPPGTGKSMLAKALPSLLPPLNREEVLQITHLHSLASYNFEQIIAERPFRAPHHSASYTAITGGGPQLRPGELSLAHHGVLFFDEMPEFARETLEAMRQPLEDHLISIARAHGRADYPANFILVATGNPCPCGYYGSEKVCECSESERKRYQSRLSGPIIDRIDLHCFVGEIEYNKLLTQRPDSTADTAIRTQVTLARQRQARRFKTPTKLNADMTNVDIKRYARLEPLAVQILNKAAVKMKLSARSYMRSLRVARTIADLDDSAHITVAHLTQALRYHPDYAKMEKS